MTQYRYRLPAQNDRLTTQSFGIEPYYVREKDGREIKAGKAIVRCVIYNGRKQSREWAESAATRIVELLNQGREYIGQKTLLFTYPHPVEQYFND